MAHAHRAHVHVRMLLVRIVQRIAEHLRPRLELRVHLEADGWLIIAHIDSILPEFYNRFNGLKFIEIRSR